MEAYDTYLRGNQYRDIDTADSNQLARASFRRAVALDAAFAAAYGALAVSEARVLDQLGPNASSSEQAIAAAEKAIQLSPDEPDGYWARGLIEFIVHFDWRSARADLEKARMLDPNDPRVRLFYGMLLAQLGQLDAGVKEVREATVVDPLSPSAWYRLTWLLDAAGRYDEALQAAHRASSLVVTPGVYIISGDAELLKGHPAAARDVYSTGIDEGDVARGVAMAEYSLGHKREAGEALDKLIHNNADTWAYQVAQIYAWWGERDRAFDWLERAFRQHDGGLCYVTYDPFVRSLRSDPRYKALLRRLKLPE